MIVKGGAFATVALLAACSSEEVNLPNKDVAETATVAQDVKVVSDPDALAQYVTNYKMPNQAQKIRRAPALEEWDMPALPESFDGMTKLEVNPWWPGVSLDGNTNFYVAEGENLSFSQGMNANNKVNLYVYGTLTASNIQMAQGMNIYIAPTGKLELTGTDWDKNPGVLKDDKPTNLYIYKGGQYIGDYSSKSKANLYVEGDLNAGDVEFGGEVRIKGTLEAGSLTTNNAKFEAASVSAKTWTYNNDSKVTVGYEINVAGDVTINAQNVAIQCQEYTTGGFLHMENNSVLYAYERIHVGDYFENSSQGIVYTPCLYVEEKFYMKNSGTVEVPQHIYCNSFEASASGFTIKMAENALFESASDFTIQNKNWAIAFENDADTQSAIVAKKFEIMEGQAAYISGYVYLSAAEYWGKPSENTRYYVDGDDYQSYTLQETVKATINGVKVITKPEECSCEFELPGTPAPEPPTITELISEIKHTHDISATCVAINNGKAYFSWHKRGTSIHGCLEALVVENDMARLTSWMEVDDDHVEGGDNWGGNSSVNQTDEAQGQFDFNHLIVADGQVVTVGDNAKMGGFIGAIALNPAGDFGTFPTLQEAFRSRQLLGKVELKIGRSGNTVLYANGKYYIACAGGFQEYNGNINDLFEKNGDKWAKSLGEYELTAGSAKHIAINPAGDKVATLEFTSKSSIAEGDDYWFNDTETALNGKLKVRNANSWLNDVEWEADINGIAPIYGKNTVAIDADGKVYVSAGKQGLQIYKDGNKVGEFSLAAEYPKAGVNGVAIDSKYIYVAYSVAGLWILDKNDLSVVSWYKSNAPEGYTTQAAAASANYVALDGTYIYVAYGRHGVKVLKLND